MQTISNFICLLLLAVFLLLASLAQTAPTVSTKDIRTEVSAPRGLPRFNIVRCGRATGYQGVPLPDSTVPPLARLMPRGRVGLNGVNAVPAPDSTVTPVAMLLVHGIKCYNAVPEPVAAMNVATRDTDDEFFADAE